MATYYEIPLKENESRFEIRTTFDDVEYVLFIYWLSRQERWCMDVKNSNSENLVQGIVLNVDRELFEQFRSIEGMPQGALFFIDISDAHLESGLDELGDRCKLIYVS